MRWTPALTHPLGPLGLPGGQHESFPRPSALGAQAGLWDPLTQSFPPLSERSGQHPCPALRGSRGPAQEPPLLPSLAGGRRDAGPVPLPRLLWRPQEVVRPQRGGRGWGPGGGQSDGAGEATGGAPEVSDPGDYRAGSLRSRLSKRQRQGSGRRDGQGPRGPLSLFCCFPGQNPTHDPPP